MRYKCTNIERNCIGRTKDNCCNVSFPPCPYKKRYITNYEAVQHYNISAEQLSEEIYKAIINDKNELCPNTILNYLTQEKEL